MSGNGDKAGWVTLKDLDAKMDKFPTRWEVRTLILLAFLGGQVVPSVQWQQPVKSGLASIVRHMA